MVGVVAAVDVVVVAYDAVGGGGDTGVAVYVDVAVCVVVIDGWCRGRC